MLVSWCRLVGRWRSPLRAWTGIRRWRRTTGVVSVGSRIGSSGGRVRIGGWTLHKRRGRCRRLGRTMTLGEATANVAAAGNGSVGLGTKRCTRSRVRGSIVMVHAGVPCPLCRASRNDVALEAVLLETCGAFVPALRAGPKSLESLCCALPFHRRDCSGNIVGHFRERRDLFGSTIAELGKAPVVGRDLLLVPQSVRIGTDGFPEGNRYARTKQDVPQ
jgi:hypothetical protein